MDMYPNAEMKEVLLEMQSVLDEDAEKFMKDLFSKMEELARG